MGDNFDIHVCALLKPNSCWKRSRLSSNTERRALVLVRYWNKFVLISYPCLGVPLEQQVFLSHILVSHLKLVHPM